MASVDGEGGAVSEGAGTRDGQNVLLVHDRLRDAILRGEIAAGETASQVTLARDLEVGRTPLREALRMLQREGLVVSEPNRRVRIAGLSAADMEAITVMRIGLETVAVRITVPTLQSGQIAELEGYMAQMDHFMRVGDTSGMRPAHRAFHQLLVAGAGDRIAEMLGEWFDHAERYRLQYGAQTKARLGVAPGGAPPPPRRRRGRRCRARLPAARRALRGHGRPRVRGARPALRPEPAPYGPRDGGTRHRGHAPRRRRPGRRSLSRRVSARRAGVRAP